MAMDEGEEFYIVIPSEAKGWFIPPALKCMRFFASLRMTI
jgi:hypothetical protein